jgi:hypothetical protein
MARTAVNGALVEIATTFGASKAFASITNATSAVASFAADPALADLDIFYVPTSGWEDATGRVLRADNPTGTGPYSVTFDGFNTSDTNRYPAGAGAGSIIEVLTWATIGQILGDTFNPSGDEQQYLTWQYLSANRQQQMPTTRTPGVINFEVHDDANDAGQLAVFSSQDQAAETPFRITLRDDTVILGLAFFSISNIPLLQGNNIVRRAVSLSFQQIPTTYAP